MGHMLFCILFSKAEMLKRTKGSGSGSGDEDETSWQDQWKLLVANMFAKFKGHFDLLLPPFGQASESTLSSLLSDAEITSSYYTWQFLALLAMNVDSDSCHEMVAELRIPILAFSNHPNPSAISNVNLLLHVIGLDASQLSGNLSTNGSP
jgi:Topoisomerase II-associated protein PAT1